MSWKKEVDEIEARRVADIIDDNGAVSGRNLPATDPRTHGKDSRLAR